MGGSRRLLAVAFTLVVAAAPARAQGVAYDNGPPTGLSGNEMTGWLQASDFQLASPKRINGVRFWAADGNNLSYSGQIFWALAANAGGVPGATLRSGLVTPTRVFSHNTFFGPSYLYSFGISPVTLHTSIYWLMLHNGPLSNDQPAGMYWESTVPNLTLHDKEDPAPFNGSWHDTPDVKDHAFQLASPTPEPGALLLMATGIAGVAAVARRRKRGAKGPSA